MRPSTLLFALLTAVAVLAGVPAGAQLRHSETVSEDPVDWTPHVENGIVRAVTIVGDTVVVGGEFSRVAESDGSQRSYQRNLLAFDRETGRIDWSFQPGVDGPVYALAPGGDGTVYIGGGFRNVNGVPQQGLARLDAHTGALLDSIKDSGVTGGEVRGLARHGDLLYVGGGFKTIGGHPVRKLARLDTRTDTVDADFDLRVARPTSGRLRVHDLAVSRDGERLAIIGTFTKVAGRRRQQIAVIDTAAARPTSWSTGVFEEPCHPAVDSALRGVDFAPDGSYFVAVTSGRRGGDGPRCDAAIRFETGSGEQRPSWVNKTGGDTLYSVAVTGAAVYVGGHQRWLDNPHGDDSAGPGAVERRGIGAIDPDTGKATSWNPTRTRGIGVQCLLATPEGLWVVSDTERLGHEHHGRVGMFPL